MIQRFGSTSSAPITRRSRHRRIGLTLAETAAIVVALCCVLAVIVPALAETRRRGKDTVCLQNLHRIAQASLTYSGRDVSESALPAGKIEDPDQNGFDSGFYSETPAYAYGGKSGLGISNGTLNIVTSPFGPLFGLASADRPLNRVLSREPFPQLASRPGQGGVKWIGDAKADLDVYSCPADSGFSGMHINTGWAHTRATSYTFFGTSYAANVMWIGYPFGPQFSLSSNSPYLRSLSRVCDPARTIAYMENNGRSAWRAKPDLCIVEQGLSGTCQGWHGKAWTFNTAFLDGRVDTIYMRGYRNEPLAHSPYSSPINLSCIVVRGDGWQVDALPSPPVPTTHPNPFGDRRVP